MSNILVNNFIRQFNELEKGSLWFDQSFRDKLENLPESIVFVKPSPEVHSVAEHVAHILAWREECILRFKGGKRELMNTAEDWPTAENLQKLGWTQLKKSLFESTQSMIQLLLGKDDAYLDTVFQDTEYTYKYLLEGIVHHDVYHLGQIGVTLRIVKQSGV